MPFPAPHGVTFDSITHKARAATPDSIPARVLTRHAEHHSGFTGRHLDVPVELKYT